MFILYIYLVLGVKHTLIALGAWPPGSALEYRNVIVWDPGFRGIIDPLIFVTNPMGSKIHLLITKGSNGTQIHW